MQLQTLLSSHGDGNVQTREMWAGYRSKSKQSCPLTRQPLVSAAIAGAPCSPVRMPTRHMSPCTHIANAQCRHECHHAVKIRRARCSLHFACTSCVATGTWPQECKLGVSRVVHRQTRFLCGHSHSICACITALQGSKQCLPVAVGCQNGDVVVYDMVTRGAACTLRCSFEAEYALHRAAQHIIALAVMLPQPCRACPLRYTCRRVIMQSCDSA